MGERFGARWSAFTSLGLTRSCRGCGGRAIWRVVDDSVWSRFNLCPECFGRFEIMKALEE